ncbi:hypothetical protein PIB30_042265, partial [Stylosanthes scabra]|nr:hypothetical protein [Stylosanthes scabra]
GRFLGWGACNPCFRCTRRCHRRGSRLASAWIREVRDRCLRKWVSARLDKRCRRLLIDGLESSFLLLRCFFLLIVSCFQQFVIAAYKVGRIHQCSGCCFSEILEGVKIIITLLIGLKIKI